MKKQKRCRHRKSRVLSMGNYWCQKCGALGYQNPWMTSRAEWELPLKKTPPETRHEPADGGRSRCVLGKGAPASSRQSMH